MHGREFTEAQWVRLRLGLGSQLSRIHRNFATLDFGEDEGWDNFRGGSYYFPEPKYKSGSCCAIAFGTTRIRIGVGNPIRPQSTTPDFCWNWVCFFLCQHDPGFFSGKPREVNPHPALGEQLDMDDVIKRIEELLGSEGVYRWLE